MNSTGAAANSQAGLARSSDSGVIAPVRATDTGANTRAAIQTWTGKAIAEQIHAKQLGAAYRLWMYHRATRLPRLRDMYAKPSSNLGDSVVSVKVGDEHVVVAQSEEYLRDLGQDLRGTRSSELKFATANSLRELYDECLALKRPAYARYISSLSDQNVYWEVLILPLSVDGQSPPIFIMCCSAMLSEKVDVLQILYDRSPVGIVAAVPIMHGQNKTDDARILTLNARARQILKQDPSRGQMHTVGELIRYLGEGLRWSATNTSSDGQATHVDYRDPAGERFVMTIELVNQIVLISIAERARPEVAEVESSASRFARLIGLG